MKSPIKGKNKELLERFNQTVALIRSNQQELTTETNQQRKNRCNKLLSDYRSFCDYYFPHYCTAPSAAFHILLAEELRDLSTCLLLKMWPRGHAKSVNACVMIPIWLMLQDKLKFMVLVSATSDAAAGLLTDLQAELSENERLIADFGEFESSGSWTFGDFTTKKGVRFKAIGRRQSPRGLRKGANRPDYIVCDDIDDDKLVQNKVLVSEAYDWCFSALFNSFSTQGGRFLFVGNLISNYSILQKVSENPAASCQKICALLEDGSPAWPEKNTVEDINNLVKITGWRLAQKELFHNPLVEGSIFKEDWFLSRTPAPLHEYEALVVYTDPSYTNSATSDFKATVLVGKKGANYHILKTYIRRASAVEMVNWHYELRKWAGDAPLQFWMEANFIQGMHIKTFEEEAERRGESLGVRGDKRQKGDKFARISALAGLFENSRIWFSSDEEGNADMRELQEQLKNIERGSKAPDDGPDALEGAIFKLNEITKTSSQVIFHRAKKSKNNF